MKNISPIFIFTAIICSTSQLSATNKEILDQTDMKKEVMKTPNVPLYLESEELMLDILGQNNVYKKAEEGSKIAPDSNVLNAIKSNSAQYIQDLKQGLDKVEKTDSSVERQNIVQSVHYKNNPFEGFYY